MSSELSSPLASPKAKKPSTRTKRPAAKPSKPKGDHPSWKDIIRECIAAHPEEARTGVSRSTIKKFAEDRYGLEPNAANIAHLSRAIANGEGEIFTLPKGKSGKVKLYKGSPSTTKENNKPASVRKATTTAKKPSSAREIPKKTKAKAVRKPNSENSKVTLNVRTVKPKKTVSKKPAAQVASKPAVKKTATPKVSSKKAATKKTATAKSRKVSSKKTEAKKPAARAAAVKAVKAATKAPSSKTKSASKTTTRATKAKA